MSAALKWQLISVEDYLRGESTAPIKHEYVGGVVYAMAAARNPHDSIKDNVHDSLASSLRGKRCRLHGSETKVRIHLPAHLRFYYPDVHVTCVHNPPADPFQDKPVAIFEVLSRGTRRIDECEKKDAYQSIPSLRVYALIEQESAAAVVFRRAPMGIAREIYEGLAAVVPLPEIGAQLPLAAIYHGVEFRPEDDDPEMELR